MQEDREKKREQVTVSQRSEIGKEMQDMEDGEEDEWKTVKKRKRKKQIQSQQSPCPERNY